MTMIDERTGITLRTILQIGAITIGLFGAYVALKQEVLTVDAKLQVQRNEIDWVKAQLALQQGDQAKQSGQTGVLTQQLTRIEERLQADHEVIINIADRIGVMPVARGSTQDHK